MITRMKRWRKRPNPLEELPVTDSQASEKEKGKESNIDIEVDTYHGLDPATRKILQDQSWQPPDRTVRLFELLKFRSRQEKVFDVIGLLAAIVAGCAQPLMIIVFANLTQTFVNFFTLKANAGTDSPDFRQAQSDVMAEVGKLSLYLVGIGAGMLCATYIYMASWVLSGENSTRRIRIAFYKAILRQNTAFFDDQGSGSIASRIETDIDLIQRGTSENIPIAVTYLSAFVSGFVVAFIRQWKVSLVLCSTIPLIVIAGMTLDTVEAKFRPRMGDKVSQAGAIAEEAISSARIVHAYGNQERLAKRYDSISVQTISLGKKVALGLAAGVGFLFFAAFSAYALGWYFGTTLILNQTAGVGDVVAVLEAILVGSFSLSQAPAKLVQLSQGLSSSPKILDTIKKVPVIDSDSEEGDRPSCKGDIVFSHVDFIYPSRPQVKVLGDVSITFERGKMTALVGESGSGKSSIVGIIERFYNICAGTVTVDGLPLRNINIKHLRRQIGYVQQEPVLFSCTVYENVCQGLLGTEFEKAAENVKRNLVIDACRQANAHDFITKLPEGYETLVGERGSLLSGGQRQRVAIARAIIRNPSILLLDEATSALDTTSERLIQAVLDKQSKGRTVISIAHRLSTIKNADNIVVISRGKVLEQGTHDELMRDPNGGYAKLVLAQQLREEVGETDEPSAECEKESKKTSRIGLEKRQSLHRKATTLSVSSEIAAKAIAENDAIKKRYSTFTVIKRIGAFNRERLWHYVGGAVSCLISAAVMPSFGILFGFVVQIYTVPGLDVRQEANRFALWFFVVSLVAAFSIFAQFRQFMSSAEYMSRNLRLLTFRSILKQDISFFDQSNNNSGALTSAVADHAEKVKPLAGSSLGTITQNLLTMLIGVVLGIAFQWKLGLVGTACIPFCAAGGVLRLYIVIMKEERTKDEHARSAQVAIEAANAMRTVAALTREEDALNRYKQALEGPARYVRNVALFSNFFFSLSQATPFWTIGLIFWYGARLLVYDGVSIQAFFISLICVTFGAIELGNSFTYVPDASKSVSAGRSILKLVDSEPKIPLSQPKGLREPVRGHIKFDNVHFRYPTRPDTSVLRGVDIEVLPGQYVAIVGPSGSGKSTSIQLVERFYDSLKGKVTIDGHDIKDLDLSFLRSQMSLVSQDSCLYEGTIKDNILLGSPRDPDTIPTEEVWRACEGANIKTFIESLPDGLDTHIGGKGVSLSGGQRSRVCLARALIRNPKVLLLDEATAALDSESEKVVQAALDKAAKQRSTLVVAHRISTVQNADKIYVLQEGKIVESGNHQSLLALKGVYFELVAQQALNRAH